MFPELKTLVGHTVDLLKLTREVLAELKTSNELSRQIISETKQLRAEFEKSRTQSEWDFTDLGGGELHSEPAEGNFYRGNDTTSHGTGPKEPKEPGKCNSDCNGHCKADQ